MKPLAIVVCVIVHVAGWALLIIPALESYTGYPFARLGGAGVLLLGSALALDRLLFTKSSGDDHPIDVV